MAPNKKTTLWALDSVSEQKRLFLDPDPAFQIFPDQIPDPGQNPAFIPSQRNT